jgi:tryptophanyl-tRNA synthetase
MKIVTDSTPPEAPKETKGSLLFDLYKEFSTADQQAALAARYASGIGWGEVKQLLFESIEAHFAASAEKYNQLMSDQSALEKILVDGARRAREVATPLMQKVRLAIRGI